MEEEFWEEVRRELDSRRNVCSELLYEEFRLPKTRHHTIKVVLIWQMLCSRPIWLLLGFLPNSQVQAKGWKAGKNRKTSPTNYQFCAFKSLITKQRNWKYWNMKCLGRWNIPKHAGRRARGKVTWPTLPPPCHNPRSPRAERAKSYF